MRQLLSSVLSCYVLFSAVSAQAQTFLTLKDTLGSIKFKIKNFGLTVDGSFDGIRGRLVWDERTLEKCFFDVSVNTTSINTGVALRDRHLKKEDYFYTAKFPMARFKSTKIYASTEPDLFQIEGELTIKETTKAISFPFRLVINNGWYCFSGQFSLNRRDYGIGGSSFSMSDNTSVLLKIWAKSG